jgi:hypothetical protein
VPADEEEFRGGAVASGSVAVCGDLRIPDATAGDDRVELTEQPGGDGGLRLGRGELVVLSGGQLVVAGGVGIVAA